MSAGAWRIELSLQDGRPDPPGAAARAALAARGLRLDAELRSSRGFLLPGRLAEDQVHAFAAGVLADAVTESVRVHAPGEAPSPPPGGAALVVRRRAGVTDPEAHTALRAMRLVGLELRAEDRVETFRGYRAAGVAAQPLLECARRALANPTIEEVWPGEQPLELHPEPAPRPAARREVALRDLDDGALHARSADMGLALSLDEMRALAAHFRAEGREPTDLELETFAQTWSEHCKHKTLTGPVRLEVRDADGAIEAERRYGNLLKETIFAATRKLDAPWCWSVFEDNAGVIALTEETGVAVKVETHNHPSALDPYGGAGTGIGGVIRDVLGTGLGARPFAATDVFCVGPEALPMEELPPGVLHPDRVLDGVVAGVRDYGNRMGIPTVAGTVLRHPGYVGNPLVFCGCVGEIPRAQVPKGARTGDLVVALGGRTGRDGIKGATFSSEALHEGSESEDAAAVQIGDPITEKKVLDVMLQARDRGLFHAVTDCGAGGFSSAVGEMGEDCGAEVELAGVPLKYPGLAPWEVWISEAQERMVAAVPPAAREELERLCTLAEVEMTVLGRFTGDRRLVVRWHGEACADLPMEFLHGGVPQPERAATWTRPRLAPTAWPRDPDWEALLLAVLGHPAVASKEEVVRQYDHEVQAATVVKPYQGARGHGPGDGVVLQPRPGEPAGVALGCGIAPRLAEIDPYAGTACAVDEAVRNVVAAGGDPHRLALLDNFCWGDCRKPDRFGSLVLAAEACHDLAMAYGAPFVSGKDSLNNEFRAGEAEQPVPPTLLCTAVAVVDDCARTVTTPLQQAGDLLVVLGGTTADGGGAVAADLLGLDDGPVPAPDPATAPALVDALHQAIVEGLVRACHDAAEGGLAAAAAEMVIGAPDLGARLDLDRVPAAGDCGAAARAFAETPTRFLLEVAPEDLDRLGALLRGLRWATVGDVRAEPALELRAGDATLARLDAGRLARAARVPGHPAAAAAGGAP